MLNKEIIGLAFRTGTSVIFKYRGKVRAGKIEKLRGDLFTMKMPEGYKSFITGRIEDKVQVGS